MVQYKPTALPFKGVLTFNATNLSFLHSWQRKPYYSDPNYKFTTNIRPGPPVERIGYHVFSSEVYFSRGTLPKKVGRSWHLAGRTRPSTTHVDFLDLSEPPRLQAFQGPSSAHRMPGANARHRLRSRLGIGAIARQWVKKSVPKWLALVNGTKD